MNQHRLHLDLQNLETLCNSMHQFILFLQMKGRFVLISCALGKGKVQPLSPTPLLLRRQCPGSNTSLNLGSSEWGLAKTAHKSTYKFSTILGGARRQNLQLFSPRRQ